MSVERNAIDICDNYSIVSHWDTLCFSFDYPIQDMFAIEHAGSAMNNQVVAIQVLRKIISGNNVDMQLLSDTFAQHSWTVEHEYRLRLSGPGNFLSVGR